MIKKKTFTCVDDHYSKLYVDKATSHKYQYDSMIANMLSIGKSQGSLINNHEKETLTCVSEHRHNEIISW